MGNRKSRNRPKRLKNNYESCIRRAYYVHQWCLAVSFSGRAEMDSIIGGKIQVQDALFKSTHAARTYTASGLAFTLLAHLATARLASLQPRNVLSTE